MTKIPHLYKSEEFQAFLRSKEVDVSQMYSKWPATTHEQIINKYFLPKNMKHGYWPTRGAAQVGRLLLAYCGHEFEDVRYTDRDKWFNEDKKNLGFDFPNLPYLIDGDFKLT